jgi:hypothetical protein
MRIVVLLSILFVIVVGTWMVEKRMAAWERPILVTVYPIIADDVAATERYVNSIDERSFDAVNRFFEREARPYGFTVTPAFRFQLAEPRRELPPAVPDQFSTFDIALWSLKMRWWAWRQLSRDRLVSPDIQMFVLYHSLNGNEELGISVGMRKGRYGIVKAYAKRGLQASNHVVFTHEMLHVLGASDKYALTTGQPIHPEGYAEPDRTPLHPQRYAEIMGGLIALSPYTATMPDSLEECRIGETTAREIGFWDQLIPGR